MALAAAAAGADGLIIEVHNDPQHALCDGPQSLTPEAFEDLAGGHVTLDIAELPKTLGTGETAVRLRREAELVKTGLNPAVLEPGDPLRLYLEEVAGTPVCGDELALAADAA